MKRYLIASAVVLALLGLYASSELVRVPAVSGTLVDAWERLDSAGFKIAAVDASGSPSEPHDLALVVSQNPAGGTLRMVGSTVTLVTRSPRDRVVMPDVVGKRLPEAVNAAHDAGLTLDTGGFIQDDVVVASTIPTAGTSVRFGSKVFYTLEGRP